MTAHTARQLRRRGALPVSWTLLVHRARLLASYLDRAGVHPGDRVAIDLPAGPALTALTYACWQSGMTVVVTEPDLPAEQKIDAFALAAPTALVSTSPGLRSSRTISTVRVRVAAEPLTVVARAVLHSGWDAHTGWDESPAWDAHTSWDESLRAEEPQTVGATTSVPSVLSDQAGRAEAGRAEAAVVVGQDDHGRPRATSFSRAELTEATPPAADAELTGHPSQIAA